MRADEERRTEAGRRDAEAQAGRRPRIRDLDEAECQQILARNALGRLAYSFRDRVDVEPVHYVHDAGWLYGRTSPGDKLEILRHSRWVAFEVDEVDGLFEWRSVVAHGAFYVLEPEGAAFDRAAFERAIELLRRLIPETGTAEDPVPHRSVIFRIHLDRLTGRESTS